MTCVKNLTCLNVTQISFIPRRITHNITKILSFLLNDPKNKKNVIDAHVKIYIRNV